MSPSTRSALFFGLIANLVVILFVGLYLALDPQRYIHGLLLLVPSNQRGQAKDLLYSIAATLRRWTLGRMLLMLANAILTSTGLWLLDVPFALTLGLIAGLLNFVPNLGPIIASVPAILVGLLESPTQAIYVAILYLAVQAVDGYIFTPLVQQQTVNVPPAMTIAAQLLMGVLLGAWGLLLATPLLAASNPLLHFPTRSSGAKCFRRWYANYLIDHSVRWSFYEFLVLSAIPFWGAANGSAFFWSARMFWVFVRLSGEPSPSGPPLSSCHMGMAWEVQPHTRILEET